MRSLAISKIEVIWAVGPLSSPVNLTALKEAHCCAYSARVMEITRVPEQDIVMHEGDRGILEFHFQFQCIECELTFKGECRIAAVMVGANLKTGTATDRLILTFHKSETVPKELMLEVFPQLKHAGN